MLRKDHSISHFSALMHSIFQWETYKPISIYTLKINLAVFGNSISIGIVKLIRKESREIRFLLNCWYIFAPFFLNYYYYFINTISLPIQASQSTCTVQACQSHPCKNILSVCFRKESIHPYNFLWIPSMLNFFLFNELFWFCFISLSRISFVSSTALIYYRFLLVIITHLNFSSLFIV